ncbi:MAG: crossover junction endodeoxyribonuclease RuvC [Alphaproteobacteria bacterium]|nr:MAG: crossover junction endodeoxyribonuclease RuvC [Alphaproteobacteria bacterium]
MRLLGLDPGLRQTGWGIIETEGSHLRHLANGTIKTNSRKSTAERLVTLHEELEVVLNAWLPTAAAVEEVFVNKNPSSTLKLGQARGVVMLAPALKGIEVAEYAPNAVKKAVVGVGHAGKDQIFAMVSMLLPGVEIDSPDAADALAVAICHAHHAQSAARIAAGRVRS